MTLIHLIRVQSWFSFVSIDWECCILKSLDKLCQFTQIFKYLSLKNKSKVFDQDEVFSLFKFT